MIKTVGRALLLLGLLAAGNTVLHAEPADTWNPDSLPEPAVRVLTPGAKLMIGGGVLSANNVRSEYDRDDGTGFALTAGVGYLVGRRAAWELGVVLFNDRLNFADISLLQLKSTWRWYLTLDPDYNDQAYVLFGPSLVLAGDDGIGDRFGGGLVLGGGVDVFCGGFGAAFIQADLTFLLMAPESKLSIYTYRASVQTENIDGPSFGVMAQLVAGARFDL